MTKGGPIVPGMAVGDVIRRYPSLRQAIRDLFGAECLSCPSNRRETITYTAWHKGLDPAEVCRLLNEAIREKAGA